MGHSTFIVSALTDIAGGTELGGPAAATAPGCTLVSNDPKLAKI